MTGEDSAWMWSIGLIAFSFGLAAGFVIHYLLNSGGGRSKELEAELEQLKEETNQYRQEVSNHFQRTSELVQEMTQSYRSVYEHLATGSEKLCSDRIQTPLLDFPEQSSLGHETTGEDTHEEKDEKADQPNTEKKAAAMESDADDYLGDAPYVPDFGKSPKASGDAGKKA